MTQAVFAMFMGCIKEDRRGMGVGHNIPNGAITAAALHGRKRPELPERYGIVRIENTAV